MLLMMKNQTVAVIVAFLAWTVTSFLCHEFGKLFLSGSHNLLKASDEDSGQASHLLASLILTTAQCMTCILCVSMTFGLRSTLTIVMVLSHVMATWVTNYSLSYIEAASTLTIKLTEPVTMAIAHYIVFKTPVSTETIVSFPLIIFGALIFSKSRNKCVSQSCLCPLTPGIETCLTKCFGINKTIMHMWKDPINKISHVHPILRTNLASTDSLGISLAFLSNIILAARNVAIKKLQVTTLPVQLRSLSRVCGLLCVQAIVLMVMYLLENDQVVPAKSCFIVTAMFISGIGHVTYSFISTNIVLKVMNIVSHSIANIVKRLLVVFLLYSFGKRSAMAWNFFGLTVTFVGLYIYLMGNLKVHLQNSTSHNRNLSFWASKPFHRCVILCMGLISVLSLVNASRHFHINTVRLHGNYSGLNLGTARELVDSVINKQGALYYSYKPAELNVRYKLSNTTDSDLKYVTNDEFLAWRLVDHPEETDLRAKTLTTNVEIIEEIQRVLINLLSDLIGPIQHVMLMEIATYSNKGDPAIATGEIMLLRKMNKTIVYYCSTSTCNKDKHLEQEIEISKNYTEDNLVILMQGGGNLVGYDGMDEIRKKIMDRYVKHRKILLSQSIWLTGKNNGSLMRAQKIYSNRTNLTMFLRDRQSLGIAKKYFHGVKFILAPDLAFGLGPLPRQMPPMYDIIWLKRKDDESSKYALPNFPNNISVQISDWTNQWTSNIGTRDMETAFLVAFSGISFLQRGRVVVTDRLHGHILSTLLNIPHVLIDNPPFFKLSSFDNSWTYGLENTVIIDNGTFALETAMAFLDKYETVLPQVGPIDMNRFPKI